MIGIRVGVRIGPKIGPAIGVGNDELGGAPMSGVTRDALSRKYVPSTAAEWTKTMSAAGIASGGPSFVWLMQAAASPIPEVVGGTVTLATGGTAGTFAQAQSGWSRLGWTIADGAAGRLLSTSASLPDPSTTSSMLLAYIAIQAAPAAQRQVLSTAGTATTQHGEVNTTLNAIAVSNGSQAGVASVGTSVRPWMAQYNKTASAFALSTDQENLVPTFSAATGKAITIGESGTTSPNLWCGYACLFTGVAAEMTPAQRRTLLTTLGWSPLW